MQPLGNTESKNNAMAELIVRDSDEGVVFTAKVVPSSSRTHLAGTLDGMLKIKISAPPEKGKANKAVIDLLSKKLGMKGSGVRIISGKTNPVKQVQIEGITGQQLVKRLELSNRTRMSE